MIAIYKRELKSYFNTATGYAFAAFMLLVAGIFTAYYSFNMGVPDFELVLHGASFIFLVLIPLLTMKSFAGEKQEKTMIMLYSMPVKTGGIVLGKYFAMVTVYILPLLIMTLYPLILGMFGIVNYLQTYTAMLAYLIFGMALIAIGMFVSSLARTQTVAAVSSLAVLLVVYLLGDISSVIPDTAFVSYVITACVIIFFGVVFYRFTRHIYLSLVSVSLLEVVAAVVYFTGEERFEGLITGMLEKLSLFDRFAVYINGVFDLSGIVYYLSIVAVFVFLTVQTIERERR